MADIFLIMAVHYHEGYDVRGVFTDLDMAKDAMKGLVASEDEGRYADGFEIHRYPFNAVCKPYLSDNVAPVEAS